MGKMPGDYHGDEDFIEAEARLGDDEYELECNEDEPDEEKIKCLIDFS